MEQGNFEKFLKNELENEVRNLDTFAHFTMFCNTSLAAKSIVEGFAFYTSDLMTLFTVGLELGYKFKQYELDNAAEK